MGESQRPELKPWAEEHPGCGHWMIPFEEMTLVVSTDLAVEDAGFYCCPGCDEHRPLTLESNRIDAGLMESGARILVGPWTDKDVIDILRIEANVAPLTERTVDAIESASISSLSWNAQRHLEGFL